MDLNSWGEYWNDLSEINRSTTESRGNTPRRWTGGKCGWSWCRNHRWTGGECGWSWRRNCTFNLMLAMRIRAPTQTHEMGARIIISTAIYEWLAQPCLNPGLVQFCR